MRTFVVAILLTLGLLAPAQAAWRRPVPGAVARPFDYAQGTPFRAGAHRGVDLSARPGSAARAACTGVVVTAAMHVVTLRCGPWRVTELPLASVAVRLGSRVRAGMVVGRVGVLAGHTGLHLGVRRARDPFAYVDPAPLLRTVDPRPPVAAGPRVRREGPRPAPPRPAPPAPVAARSDVLHAGSPRGVRVSADPDARGLAPWPAWVGLGLLALGAVGGGVKLGLRRRVGPLADPAPEEVPSAP
jgi:hypothetical protein